MAWDGYGSEYGHPRTRRISRDTVTAVLTVLALAFVFFAGWQASTAWGLHNTVTVCESHGHGVAQLGNPITGIAACVIQDGAR